MKGLINIKRQDSYLKVTFKIYRWFFDRINI